LGIKASLIDPHALRSLIARAENKKGTTKCRILRDLAIVNHHVARTSSLRLDTRQLSLFV